MRRALWPQKPPAQNHLSAVRPRQRASRHFWRRLITHSSKILALRQIILGADPSIAEGVKWNAPSFRTSEYFATFHLRAKDGVQVILHLGAKPRDGSTPGVVIADPEALLEWLAKDRASATFRDLNDIDARQSAFAHIIRQWIVHI